MENHPPPHARAGEPSCRTVADDPQIPSRQQRTVGSGTRTNPQKNEYRNTFLRSEVRSLMLCVRRRAAAQDSGGCGRRTIQRIERPGQQTRPEDRQTGPKNRSIRKNACAGRSGPCAGSENSRTRPAENPGTTAKGRRNTTNGRGGATKGGYGGPSGTASSDAA